MNKHLIQRGFSLIELIVVILLLGILAATALPKFMNVTTSAHKSAVAGVTGAFASALQLARAQYVVNGNTTTATNVQGFGDGTVDFSSNGWPTDTAGTTALASGANAQCVNVWSGIMQSPPSIATGTGSDWCAVAAAANVCTYVYLKDAPSAASCATSATGVTRYFTYDVTSGVVVPTNP